MTNANTNALDKDTRALIDRTARLLNQLGPILRESKYRNVDGEAYRIYRELRQRLKRDDERKQVGRRGRAYLRTPEQIPHYQQ